MGFGVDWEGWCVEIDAYIAAALLPNVVVVRHRCGTLVEPR
jgi:hypothetical protein